MSKTSGGIRSAHSDGGGKENAVFSVFKREPLKNISDPILRKEVKRAISKFDSRLGIGTSKIFLAEFDGNQVRKC